MISEKFVHFTQKNSNVSFIGIMRKETKLFRVTLRMHFKSTQLVLPGWSRAVDLLSSFIAIILSVVCSKRILKISIGCRDAIYFVRASLLYHLCCLQSRAFRDATFRHYPNLGPIYQGIILEVFNHSHSFQKWYQNWTITLLLKYCKI